MSTLGGMDTPVQQRFSWLYLIPTAIALVGGIFIGMSINVEGQGSSGPVAEDQAPQETQQAMPEPAAAVEQSDLPDLSRKDESDPAAIGAADAPVVMAVYSDYQCRYCVKWSEDTLPQLQPYIDSGQLRLEYRNLALFGEGSQTAAQGAYAAGLQGKFEEFSTEVFEPGNVRPAEELTEEGLVKIAEEVGLDPEKFREDYNSDAVLGAVSKHQSEARSLGVTSTPTFVVNKRPVIGAQPAEVFVMTVEAELEAVGK